MRVLHVIDALGMGGGSEHSLATLLPPLRERGIDSRVACLYPRRGGLQERLREDGFEVRLLADGTRAAKILSLRRWLRELQPDLVHATLFNACIVSRLAVLGVPATPLVNSLVSMPYDPMLVRHLGIPRWKLEILRGVDRVTAGMSVDRFHAVSEAVKQAAVTDLGIAPRRVEVIQRARSTDALGEPSESRRLAVRDRLGVSAGQPVLLTVGRQDPQKGQIYLVRALQGVLRAHPSTVLFLAGREGSASAAIREHIQSHGLSAAVRCLGHRDDVPDLLSAADVFVLPSLVEGTGGAAIEAMALGVPVVASDIPAMREVVADPGAGVLSPPGDPEKLAAILSSLLGDAALRRQLGERGRRRFLSRHTVTVVADSTLRFYRTVCGAG